MEKLFSIWFKIRDYITIGLAASTLMCGIGWYVTSLKLDNERLARKADATSYYKAQTAYMEEAIRQKTETERKANERVKKANADYSALLSKYDAALVRFKTSQRKSSGTNLPVPSGATTVSDGRTPHSEFLTDTLIISYADAEICAENTARVQNTYDWSKTYGE